MKASEFEKVMLIIMQESLRKLQEIKNRKRYDPDAELPKEADELLNAAMAGVSDEIRARIESEIGIKFEGLEQMNPDRSDPSS
jgi:hypothetical protein